MLKINNFSNILSERFRGFLPVIIDLETTGTDPQKNAIIEIGVNFIKMNENGDLESDSTISYNVKPFEGAEINQASIEFIKIDPFDPKREAQDESIVIKDLCKQVSQKVKESKCKRAILVGHNAHFDHSFLMKSIERIKYKRSPFHPFSCIDTVSLSAIFLGHTVLATSCEIAEIEYDTEKAHHALYDAEITTQLFCKITNYNNELRKLAIKTNQDTESTNSENSNANL